MQDSEQHLSASQPFSPPKPCFVDHPCTLEQWRAKAEALWQLLDDISTGFDAYRPTMDRFAWFVNAKCEKRNEHMTSDGYDLFATKCDS